MEQMEVFANENSPTQIGWENIIACLNFGDLTLPPE